MKTFIFKSMGLLFLFSGQAFSADNPKGTEVINIQTDQLPPASAEEVTPKAPFFSEPTTGNEVMEAVEELKQRVEKLEESSLAKITEKSDGTLVIESKGPIEIKSPSSIKLQAKTVEFPNEKN